MQPASADALLRSEPQQHNPETSFAELGWQDNVTPIRRTAESPQFIASLPTSALESEKYLAPLDAPRDWSVVDIQFDELDHEMTWISNCANAAAWPSGEHSFDEPAEQAYQLATPFDRAANLNERHLNSRQLRAIASAEASDQHYENNRERRSFRQDLVTVGSGELRPNGDVRTFKLDQHQFDALQAGLAAIDILARQISASQDLLHRGTLDHGIPINAVGIKTHALAAPRRVDRSPLKRVVLSLLLATTLAGLASYYSRADVSWLWPSSAKMATPYVEDSFALLGYAPVTPARVDLTQQPPAPSLERHTMPLPSMYGIYAVSSGQLIELEALPGQVPDSRIAISAPISRPSHVTLPDGHVSFIAFRRDLASVIADRVSVKIVARLKQNTAAAASEHDRAVRDTWTIRNVGFEFGVAPVDRNRDMVTIRSKDGNFAFPPGRYALEIKGQAYDFAVPGQVSDPSQCLERFEAENGGFYHECQDTVAMAGSTAPPGKQSPSDWARKLGIRR